MRFPRMWNGVSSPRSHFLSSGSTAIHTQPTLMHPQNGIPLTKAIYFFISTSILQLTSLQAGRLSESYQIPSKRSCNTSSSSQYLVCFYVEAIYQWQKSSKKGLWPAGYLSGSHFYLLAYLDLICLFVTR